VNLTEQKKVLMMAGGTGGHIFPALAIAEEMRQRHLQIIWLGTRNGMENRLVPENNYPIEYIDITGLRGKGLFSLLSIPYKLSRALIQTFLIFRRIKPDLTVGMGGFVSGPGGLVSWIMGKPLVIHEQNAVSGLSNNLLSIIAQQCLCAFPDAYRGFFTAKLFKRTKENTHCKVTGNPFRKEILALNEHRNKKPNKAIETIKVLIIGGSLGAQKINEIVPQAIQKLQTKAAKNNKEFYKNIEVKHQCGKGKAEQVKSIISGEFFQQQAEIKINYQVEEFISDMAEVYHWADLIICRSGALTISEIAVVGIASVLIPFPYAVDDHQTENAKYLSANQAAFLMPENKLTVTSLTQIIEQCSPEKLDDMAAKAKKLAKPNATIDATKHCLYWLDSDTHKPMVDSNGVIK